MNQRHKHADVVIAWAEGKAVQVWDDGAKCWCDVVKSIPFFDKDWEYRIKPPPKKYRVALFRLSSEAASTYTACTDIQEEADSYEQHSGFVRWLTDWIEYEESLK